MIARRCLNLHPVMNRSSDPNAQIIALVAKAEIDQDLCL